MRRGNSAGRGGVCVTFAMQSPQLPAIKGVHPWYREINAQVLLGVLHRLDKACAAFFRRLQAGEQPGYPRFQGQDRYHSFTSPQGARRADTVGMAARCWTAGC
jgi:putative transposase